MNYKLSLLLLVGIIVGISNLSVYAYVEEASNEPYIDKFKPSTGVKIKESGAAGWIEEATRRATYGNPSEKEDKEPLIKRRPVKKQRQKTSTRSYKWF